MTRRNHINPPLNIYRKIALSFIIIVAVLIGVIFYFTLSYAYVTVYPKSQEINSDFNFIVVEDEQAAKPDEGILSGKIVDETIEAEKVFPATGTTILAGDTLGKVKIFNNLERSQILVATTRLLTADNVLFRIKNRVEIPARGSVDAVAYPDDPTKPLAKAGAKFTIPGLSSSLQQLVYGQAVEDFLASGQPVKIVSKEDLSKALESYGDELARQAIIGIDADQATVLKKEILSQEFSNKEGDKVSEFKLKLKIRVSGAIFDQQEVIAYSKKVLEQVLPEGKELVSDSSNQLILEPEKVDFANKLAQLKSNIIGIAVISENNSVFDRDKFKSMSVEELKSSLSNIEDIEKVEIKMFPGWMKKMPYFQDHILIKVMK